MEITPDRRANPLALGHALGFTLRVRKRFWLSANGEEVITVSRTATGMPDDWRKWLALATAAASLGLLPRGWQKALGVASAVVLLCGALSE